MTHSSWKHELLQAKLPHRVSELAVPMGIEYLPVGVAEYPPYGGGVPMTDGCGGGGGGGDTGGIDTACCNFLRAPSRSSPATYAI